MARSETKNTCANPSVIAVVSGSTATAQIPHDSATNAPTKRRACIRGCLVRKLSGNDFAIDGSDDKKTITCLKNRIYRTWYPLTATLAIAATVANSAVAASAHSMPLMLFDIGLGLDQPRDGDR